MLKTILLVQMKTIKKKYVWSKNGVNVESTAAETCVKS